MSPERTSHGLTSGGTIRRVAVSARRVKIGAGRVAVVDFSHGRAVAAGEVLGANASGQ
jgi:hypothetical protein